MQTSTIEIKTAEGVMPAHLAEPAGEGPFPAVVVIMEAFGLVPHIQDVANRLAGEGYVALAPDFYYRRLPDNKVSYDQLEQAIALMQTIDDDKFLEDLRATIQLLQSLGNVRGERVGVTGFCMGGRLCFLAAAALPEEIAAAAPFYGGGITAHLDRAESIRAPLQLFFGEQDAFIPLDQVREIEARLEELGKDFKLNVYPGAEHGFFCDERPSYAPDAARDAWSQLKTFLATHLGR